MACFRGLVAGLGRLGTPPGLSLLLGSGEAARGRFGVVFEVQLVPFDVGDVAVRASVSLRDISRGVLGPLNLFRCAFIFLFGTAELSMVRSVPSEFPDV